MPDPNTPSGDETGSPEKSTETGKYPADAQKAIDQANQRAEKAEAERKKANEEAASYRLKEKEAADKKAIENGEAAKLVESLTKELEETKSLTAAQKAKLDKIEADRRKELTARLPQDKAKNYETVPLDILETIAADFATAPASGNSQGNERGAAGGNAPLSLDGMTNTQLNELRLSNPQAYNKLMDTNKGK
jgi:hypothetical protein